MNPVVTQINAGKPPPRRCNGTHQHELTKPGIGNQLHILLIRDLPFTGRLANLRAWRNKSIHRQSLPAARFVPAKYFRPRSTLGGVGESARIIQKFAFETELSRTIHCEFGMNCFGIAF